MGGSDESIVIRVVREGRPVLFYAPQDRPRSRRLLSHWNVGVTEKQGLIEEANAKVRAETYGLDGTGATNPMNGTPVVSTNTPFPCLST